MADEVRPNTHDSDYWWNSTYQNEASTKCSNASYNKLFDLEKCIFENTKIL